MIIDDGEILEVMIITRRGGSRRYTVVTEFDSGEIADVKFVVSPVDVGIKSEVVSKNEHSPVDN